MNNSKTSSRYGGWIFLCVAIMSLSYCQIEKNKLDAQRESITMQNDKERFNLPEQSFRFCISTAAGTAGIVSADQIRACRDASMKTSTEE